MDVQPAVVPRMALAPSAAPPAAAVQSFRLFDEGLSVEEAAERLDRAVSTTYGYLEAYIRHRRITDPTPWISSDELQQVEAAVQIAGAERLRPIHDALDGRIGYERIRLALVCLGNRSHAAVAEEH
jgi:ATP-dependent DNA helicase RecQ